MKYHTIYLAQNTKAALKSTAMYEGLHLSRMLDVMLITYRANDDKPRAIDLDKLIGGIRLELEKPTVRIRCSTTFDKAAFMRLANYVELSYDHFTFLLIRHYQTRNIKEMYQIWSGIVPDDLYKPPPLPSLIVVDPRHKQIKELNTQAAALRRERVRVNKRIESAKARMNSHIDKLNALNEQITSLETLGAHASAKKIEFM